MGVVVQASIREIVRMVLPGSRYERWWWYFLLWVFSGQVIDVFLGWDNLITALFLAGSPQLVQFLRGVRPVIDTIALVPFLPLSFAFFIPRLFGPSPTGLEVVGYALMSIAAYIVFLNMVYITFSGRTGARWWLIPVWSLLLVIVSVRAMGAPVSIGVLIRQHLMERIQERLVVDITGCKRMAVDAGVCDIRLRGLPEHLIELSRSVRVTVVAGLTEEDFDNVAPSAIGKGSPTVADSGNLESRVSFSTYRRFDPDRLRITHLSFTYDTPVYRNLSVFLRLDRHIGPYFDPQSLATFSDLTPEEIREEEIAKNPEVSMIGGGDFPTNVMPLSRYVEGGITHAIVYFTTDDRKIPVRASCFYEDENHRYTQTGTYEYDPGQEYARLDFRTCRYQH